jgi:hypothetical protein
MKRLAGASGWKLKSSGHGRGDGDRDAWSSSSIASAFSPAMERRDALISVCSLPRQYAPDTGELNAFNRPVEARAPRQSGIARV